MRYTVSLVESAEDLEEFLSLQARLYFDHPCFTPAVLPDERALLGDSNPYFAVARRELLLCRRNGLPVGRLAIVHDPRMRGPDGEPLDTFGHFDSAEDELAVTALLAEARSICRARDVRWLEGPFNPTHYAPAGVQLDAFDLPPSTLQTFTPEWVPAALLRQGFRLTTTATYYSGAAAHEDVTETDCRVGEYSAREVAPAEVLGLLPKLAGLLNASFADNHRYASVTTDELAFMSLLLRPAFRGGGIAVVEHHGQIVGVMLGMADLAAAVRSRAGMRNGSAASHERKLIVLAIGLLEEHRHTRATVALLRAWQIIARRFDRIESSWIDDRNAASIAVARRVGLEPVKHYGLFTTQL